MPSDTRERLTEAAARRFYRDGFRNVGLDQVLADVGISKTAFYKHFACKEDLILAALEMKNRWLQETVRDMIHQHTGSAVGQLRGLLEVAEQIISNDEFQGCIFVNVAMEFPLPHDPVHVAAAQHKQSIEDIIHDLAAAAGAVDPRTLAREFCLILEGVYVTRQVTGNKRSIDIGRRIIDLLLAAHLPETASVRK
jgi:AcrR family transcriptional regulator